ncbi:hypothetical protein BU25DRAFT_149394 [Macroventuria anomochaeta]|uniref:Uncharacterized protein n=1 Tax=Macroventuria anomochaeta TaxID=301207 RepID=A0ACB6SFD5_9PLEO|nr:uncharacterized protein BU25DRAFT_149394 [Macroventuria anomochaeta]KAF2632320.1 hypothetical protein BU25DRAFT_149394 [Macroventuria anomochaeta]
MTCPTRLAGGTGDIGEPALLCLPSAMARILVVWFFAASVSSLECLQRARAQGCCDRQRARQHFQMIGRARRHDLLLIFPRRRSTCSEDQDGNRGTPGHFLVL